MAETPRQLPLDLPLAPAFGREDFLVSPSNEPAYALVERWPQWPDRILRLSGPPGSGKSHLAAIWAEASGAAIVPAPAVTQASLAELGARAALVVEDADRGGLDEAALFHLLNMARGGGGHLLLTHALPVNAWRLSTPDLVSRLRLAPAVALAPPDDALLRAVLVKLFVDRQLVVDTSVVDFVALRIARSLGEAARVVAELDREALSLGRRITRAMAAQVLARVAGTEPERSYAD